MMERGGMVGYFESLAAALPEPAQECATSSDSTYRKVSTLIRAAGQKKMSQRLRDELAAAVRMGGLHSDLPLDDPTLGPNDKVCFSKAPFPTPTLSPSSEDSLRAWVLSLVGRPGPFSRCYKPELEFKIPGRKRYIDLLLHERGKAGQFGGFLVVEFESSAPAGTVAQTLSYMRELRKTPLAHGKYVRGAIVCARDHPRERAVLDEVDDDIRWFVLDARLKEHKRSRDTGLGTGRTTGHPLTSA